MISLPPKPSALPSELDRLRALARRLNQRPQNPATAAAPHPQAHPGAPRDYPQFLAIDTAREGAFRLATRSGVPGQDQPPDQCPVRVRSAGTDERMCYENAMLSL